MNLSPEQIEEFKIRTAFIPRKSKDDLHLWIAEYFGIEVPDTIVDPRSTASMMDYIWWCYSRLIWRTDADVTKILTYAHRDGGKTLSTAILEALAIFHGDVDCGHMAAIEKQAVQAQKYVQAFFNRDYFRPYIAGNNTRNKILVRHEDARTGWSITQKEWIALPPEQRYNYKMHTARIGIVICTPRGANGDHVPFFVADELDLANAEAYEESKMIPTSKDGVLPLTVLTSTRKYSFGLVQKELDNAEKSRLKVMHWNVIDGTEYCKPERHQPQRPKRTVFVDDENLQVLTPEEFSRQPASSQERFVQEEAFDGCFANCEIYAVCRGRLATHQRPRKYEKASTLLKPIDQLQANLRHVDPDYVNAQLLCRKPSTKGLIYPLLDPQTHLKSAKQIVEMVTGQPARQEYSIAALFDFFMQRGAQFYVGMDFGYTHAFAAVLGVVDKGRLFILSAVAQAELMTHQQIEQCDAASFKRVNPDVYADPESPTSIKDFAKSGYRMRTWNKGPGSVLAGIGIVRRLIRPTVGPPMIYFLADNPKAKEVFDGLCKYKWKMRPNGMPSDVPDEEDDDVPDAARYLIMNTMKNAHGIAKQPDAIVQHHAPQAFDPALVTAVRQQQIMKHVFGEEHTKPIKKGRFRMV